MVDTVKRMIDYRSKEKDEQNPRMKRTEVDLKDSGAMKKNNLKTLIGITRKWRMKSKK